MTLADFDGRIYWSTTYDVVQCYDSVAGFKSLVKTQVPETLKVDGEWPRLGVLNMLPDGNILVSTRTQIDMPNSPQQGAVTNGLLEPTGATWVKQAALYQEGDPDEVYDPNNGGTTGPSGFTPHTSAGGVRDGSRTWMAMTQRDYGLYAFTAYDSNGIPQQGLGDARLLTRDPGSLGDRPREHVGGLQDWPASMSVANGHIYRTVRYGEGVTRCNLATGEWTGIKPALHAEPMWNWRHYFVGVDAQTGLMVFANAEYPWMQPNDGHLFWLETYDPAGQAWNAVVPDGLDENRMTGRLAEWDPMPSTLAGEVDYIGTFQQSGDRDVALPGDGHAYYPVIYDSAYEAGAILASICRLNLTTGVAERILDIPYTAYDAAGVEVPAEGSYDYDNGGYLIGLVVVPGAAALTAAFTWDLDDSGRLVHFDASSSTGEITTYSWEFDEHYTVLPPSQPTTGEQIDHLFYSLGPFEVTLTVSDGTATASVTHEVDLTAQSISGDYNNDRCAFS